MKNLGPVSRRWLNAVGVHDLAALRAVGPVVAYLRIEESGVKPSLNLLWGLAAAVRDIDWRDLADKDKAALRLEVERLRGE